MKLILNKLIEKGIRLSEENGQLKVQLGGAFLSDEEKADIKEHKDDILEYIAGKKIALLSFAQERLWFLSELGYSTQYHIPGLMKINGNFNAEAFKKALVYIIERHESFRTGFESHDGKAIQVVHKNYELPFEYMDVSQMEENERADKIATVKHKFLNDEFNMQKPPLLRALIIKTSEKESILGLVMHHIISDGWSIKILISEIGQVYRSYLNNVEPSLAPLPLQYMDFTIWQHGVMSGKKFDEEINYWKNQLSELEDIDLPTDFPRPSQHGGKGDTIRIQLEKETSDILDKVAAEMQVSMFTLLMSGAFILLSKYSRQTNFGLGLPVANRNNKEIEGLIGFFVNTLVVNVKNERIDELTLEELIREIHQNIINGQDYQNLPFEKIVEELSPERDLSRTPLFQILVNSVNEEKYGGGDGKSDYSMTSEEGDYKPAKFDLSFDLNLQVRDGYVISLTYAIDLFTAETAKQMLTYLAEIFKAFGSSLQQTFSGFYLMDESHIREMMALGKGEVSGATPQCMHHLIEQHALSAPESEALVLEDRVVTYKELNTRANQMAGFLQSKDVKPGDLVAISLHAGDDMMVALLAVLKAGAAYVPVDPLYPQERIKYILDDSKAGLLITSSEINENLTDCFNTVQKLFVDTDFQEISSMNKEFQSHTDPHSRAYVIYTSGSTGNPKGVEITHANLNGTVTDMCFVTIKNTDRVLQAANFAFDGSVIELFATLCRGAALAMFKREETFSVSKVASFITNKQVTVTFMTTALFNAITDSHPEALKGLRMISQGGERVSESHVSKAISIVGEGKLFNLYGPTEATVYATYFPIENKKYNGNIPIGYPIKDTSLFVVDENNKLLPKGIPGELCIAGAAVAKGYLYKEELTAQKFIDNPYQPATKMYKTGDLVKWNNDSQLEFLGRIDDQVKVRGYRIELGEIENTIADFDGIEGIAVIVREFADSKQLIAWFTGKDVNETELKAYVGSKLPDYMVPAAFIAIDKIPLT
ncbi:MAG: amino acid adenylation domain-containing protein, partial [Cyclobacteriaceae bacterium]